MISYSCGKSLLLVHSLGMAFFHLFPNCFFRIALPQKLFDFGQSFQHPVLEDYFGARIHKPEEQLTSVMMLIILLVIPTAILLLQNLELYHCRVTRLRLVSRLASVSKRLCPSLRELLGDLFLSFDLGFSEGTVSQIGGKFDIFLFISVLNSVKMSQELSLGDLCSIHRFRLFFRAETFLALEKLGIAGPDVRFPHSTGCFSCTRRSDRPSLPEGSCFYILAFPAGLTMDSRTIVFVGCFFMLFEWCKFGGLDPLLGNHSVADDGDGKGLKVELFDAQDHFC